ncbi:beta-lactamase family protein [Parasalinivibrio latis]|uniref:serine hydrolase domain-containing protein n=1 Tax=Parasalinivibrio latis TaxID=2952610 RepID=UPI0030E2A828
MKKTTILMGMSLLYSTASFAGEQQTWQDLGIMQGIPVAAEKQVTAQNWVAYPFNRWSFQNVSKILPTAELISEGATELPRGVAKDVTTLPITLSDGSESTVAALLNSHNTDSFMVLQDGKIVQEQYWNGMTPESTHWIASLSKSFTGLAAEMLIEQGKIERDKPVEFYVEALKGTGIGSATIQQVLDMTAGTAWDESPDALRDETSFARQYGNAAGTWPMGQKSNGVYGILPKIEQERPHGATFMYNAPLTDVMGWVLSSVTNQRLEDTLSDLFWRDLGAQDRAFMMVDTNTFAWATGGINISTRDAAKFGQLMANQGTFNGKQIFSEDVFNQITTGEAGKFADSKYGKRIPGGAYSSYFWLLNDDDGAFMGKGMYSQYVYVNPTENIVIVRFASPQLPSQAAYDIDMISAFKAISEHLAK